MISSALKNKGQQKITEGQRTLEPVGWRFMVLRLMAVVLGLIFLASAVLKGIDIEPFIRQIKDYNIITHRALTAMGAWGLITLECGLGMALLTLYRPRIMLPVTAFLLLVFMAATGYAWHTGGTETCGCFGVYLIRTPAQAMIEDVILLAATCLIWIGCRHIGGLHNRAKLGAVIIFCLIGFSLPLAFGFSPSSIIQPPNKTAEMEIGRMTVQGLGRMHLSRGEYLIILMDVDCQHCEALAGGFNMLAREENLPKVIALSMNNKDQRSRFIQEYQLIFPVGEIKPEAFWRLLGDNDPPQVLLVRKGHVLKTWDKTVPDMEGIRSALSAP